MKSIYPILLCAALSFFSSTFSKDQQDELKSILDELKSSTTSMSDEEIGGLS
jgi:hypothetical protein